MTINSKTLLKVLHVIAWIIFVGVLVEAGIFLVGACVVIVAPSIESYFFTELHLKGLYEADPGYFFVMSGLMFLVALARSFMFYGIVRLLSDRKLDLASPFSVTVRQFLFRISYLALVAGFFSDMGARYTVWLRKSGIDMPDTQQLRLSGADVWLFMGVVLFVIALIFKRGIEIQTENELTV